MTPRFWILADTYKTRAGDIVTKFEVVTRRGRWYWPFRQYLKTWVYSYDGGDYGRRTFSTFAEAEAAGNEWASRQSRSRERTGRRIIAERP